MQFKSSLFAVFCVLSTTLCAKAAEAPAGAIPGPNDTAVFERFANARAGPVPDASSQGHIFICTEGNWLGQCTNYAVNNNQCTNFPSGYDNQISSMGPDQHWLCVTYVNYNCDGSGFTYTVTSPGFSSLPPGIDNALSSIICYKTS